MEQKTIYYISEAAKKVQVESHVLRYWEEELALPIKRNEMGHRYYTEQDIRKLQEIKELKEQGLQLKAIRTILLRMPRATDSKTEEMSEQEWGILMQQMGKTAETEEKREEEQPELKEQQTEEAADRHESGEEQTEKLPEIDLIKPQRFVVALSKEKEEAAEADQDYADVDKSRKAARLQYLLQHMITEAVKSANRELCTDVKESILKELDYQFRMQEERDEERWKKEEEHYRKIDEMIRERHKPKERLGRGKKKSPVKDDPVNL